MRTDFLPDAPATIAAAMDGALRDGPDGVRWAALPSPSIQNHAASLARDGEGRLHCVWFGGELEGKASICVRHSVLDEASGRWGAAARLSDDPDRSEQNPMLFFAPDGRRLLLHTAQPGGAQDRCVVRMRALGAAPVDLPLASGVFIRAPIVVRDDGAWLLPVFRCTPTPGAKWTGRHDVAEVAVSADAGRSWRMVGLPGSLGCVHMALVPLGAGRIVAFFRRRQADWVHRSDSSDGGETWSAPHPTDLPNNNASIAALRLRDGRIALACNPVNAAMDPSRRVSLYDELGADARPDAEGGCEPIWGVPRAPIAIAFSADDGHTFPDRRIVAAGPGTCLSNDSEDGRNKELSYPSLLETPDGGLDVAFTLCRRAIAYVRLPAGFCRPA